MTSAQEGLKRLRAGNERYVSGSLNIAKLFSSERRSLFLKEQKPFAVILACSDSRVPVEIIFAQGLGDLFVIRVAGNIAGPSQIGSIEFAVKSWSVPLVVVLGHSMCGAVSAALESLKETRENFSPNIHSIFTQINTSIKHLAGSEVHEHETLLQKAVQANIQASIKQLYDGSEILKQRVDKQELLILGAEYSLKTARVNFHEA